MARNLKDVILMQNVISGQHPDDYCSLPKIELPYDYESVKGLKVGLCVNLGGLDIDREIEQKTRDAAEVLRQLGAEIIEIDLDWDIETMAKAAHDHFMYQSIDIYRDLLAKFPDQSLLSDYLHDLFDQEHVVTIKDEFAMWDVAEKMNSEINRKVFSECHVLLVPTMASNAVPAEWNHVTDTVAVNGKDKDIWSLILTYPFNILGRLPVVNMPIGFTSNRMPVGLQVIAPHYQDSNAFRVAAAYESAVPSAYETGVLPGFE